MLLSSETLANEKVRKCLRLFVVLRIISVAFQKYRLHFFQPGISQLSSNGKMFSKRWGMYLAICNGTFIAQKCQKVKSGLILFDDQTRYPPEQLSIIFPRRSQSTSLFLYEMNHCPVCLLYHFFENSIRPKWRKFCRYASLKLNVFPRLFAAFLHQDVNRQIFYEKLWNEKPCFLLISSRLWNVFHWRLSSSASRNWVTIFDVV